MAIKQALKEALDFEMYAELASPDQVVFPLINSAKVTTILRFARMTDTSRLSQVMRICLKELAAEITAQ